MLSDKRLENLLRDAHALETFERGDAATPKSRAVTPPPRTRRWAYYAAAAIALYVTAHLSLTAILTPRKQTAPSHATAQVEPPSKASLLLAVYQNDAGKLSCVNWSADALKGRTIASLTADELTRLGLTLACDPGAARILVVGLEGPAAVLPTSDDRAKAVAQCLSTTPPCASGTFDPQTCASAGCLDNQVTVRIESLALK